jgi:hypothetical protein
MSTALTGQRARRPPAPRNTHLNLERSDCRVSRTSERAS